MRKMFIVGLFALFSTALMGQHPVPVKPRILISTDIGGTDPDDNQSMAHFLMYSNLFNTEGLVSSPSYGAGSKQNLLTMIDLYEKDLPKLQQHAQGYPTPDALRAICKQGRHGLLPYKGYATATEGSDWIIHCAKAKSKQPLWILVWGGLDDLAQALHDDPSIVPNIRVYWIGGPNKKWGVNGYVTVGNNFSYLEFRISTYTHHQMSDRRKFIKDISAAAVLSAVPATVLANPGAVAEPKVSHYHKMWGCLLHLSYNFWVEYSTPSPYRGYRPYLQLSEDLWNDATEAMVKAGLNMVIIDLGDGVKYENHPEIAVNNAWSVERLKRELDRLRKMGLEPIPKLNFSAGHDTWLGVYSRMISTPKYYEVCADLIKEVSAIFEKPRYFHLGMDEENYNDQQYKNLVVIRQNELWWHDFHFLVENVEKNGSRAWIWSDYLWKHSDDFFKNMPRSVLQSNWYYSEKFDDETLPPVKAYTDLESHNYDQVPTGGFYRKNDADERNMMNTVQYCEKKISDPHLLGFLQTFWAPTTEDNRRNILKAINLIGEAKAWFDKNHKRPY